MGAVAEYLSGVNLELVVVAGCLLFICAVPFVEVISVLWHLHFKKG